jgi:hypothetical protein
MGLQAVHGVNGTSDNTLAYVPAYMTQVVSTFLLCPKLEISPLSLQETNPQPYEELFQGVTNPYLTTSYGHTA